MCITMAVLSESRTSNTALTASISLPILPMLMSINSDQFNPMSVSSNHAQAHASSRTSAIFFFAAALYVLFVSARTFLMTSSRDRSFSFSLICCLTSHSIPRWYCCTASRMLASGISSAHSILLYLFNALLIVSISLSTSTSISLSTALEALQGYQHVFG